MGRLRQQQRFLLLLILTFVTLTAADDLPSEQKCLNGQFPCVADHHCIPNNWVCDGQHDCKDGSDEKNCDCPEHWLDCGNGRCIANIWRCDNDNDCGNMKDEEGCDLPPELKCLSSQFPCVADHHCIPNSWVCDGQHDCKDGSDEKNCENSTENCGFRCRNNYCIPARWQCDDQVDCADGSDEEKCHLKDAICPESEFSCSSGLCLKPEVVCDGNHDCPGGEDEGKHCGDSCVNSTCQHICKSTPAGPECHCNPGYDLQKNGRTCSDINECSTEGFCSHKCVNIAGSYTCTCMEGYFLQNRTCLAKGPEPLLVFATSLEIRGYLLRTKKYFPIHKSVSRANSMDVDPVNSKLYWTDLSKQGSAVYSIGIDGSSFTSVITGLLEPEDVAVDWLGRNLYITDSGLKQILVCKIDGTFCGVLHEHDVDMPRSVVVDPPEGLVYWSDWGRSPGIFKSGMDGSKRETFVSKEIKWPNGIALDHTTSRLYWCDARTYRIEYITLDGKYRKVVLKENMFHPYSLSVFEDTIYWTDWVKFSIDSCNKFSGHQVDELIKENGKHILGIHVYHPVLEKDVSNPCWSKLCSHLCVLSPSGEHSCLCPPGFYLAQDQITCMIDPRSDQLFVSDGSLLLHVQPESVGTEVAMPIPVSSVKTIGDIAYDQRRNIIYLSDILKNTILAVNGTSFSRRDVINSHVQSPEGLEYDWIGNNLYWTDVDKGTVEVYSLNTFERIVLLYGLQRPLALALLPEKGLMFVSMIGGKNARVSMFNMDGQKEKQLASITGLPLSLALDPKENRLYWADPRSGVIASVDYLMTGNTKEVHTHHVENVVSMAVSEKFIYWTTTKSDRLFRLDRNDTRSITHSISLDKNNRTAIRKVKYIKTYKRDFKGGCSHENGGCSHVCLQNPSGRTCACPVGYILGSDGKTCKVADSCSKTEIRCKKGSLCIPLPWVCDGSPDCDDGSDEENCGNRSCSEEQFQCKNGRCISPVWVCDNIDDCGDTSDEALCPTQSPCNDYEFDCGNGMCSPLSWRCDGQDDCNNNKDEEGCQLIECKSSQLRCDGDYCYPKSWTCDGTVDCADGTDEQNCANTTSECKTSEFHCRNGICVDKNMVCDHRNDCQDNSDEQNCVYNTTCKEEMFQCDDGLCIYDHEVCDGTKDCDEGEDEKNCNRTECDKDFYCSSSRRCIPRKWLCDGDEDCSDGADEHLSMCGERTSTSTVVTEKQCGEFSCNTGECLPWLQVCDGVPDCVDYSDEGNLCASSCGKNNGGCSHLCLPTPGGPRCSCLSGFLLGSDHKTCEDENECFIPGTCSQFCNNTKGSFKCSCAEGYFLTFDRRKCKAVGGDPTLLYLLPDQIRGIKLSSHSTNLYISRESPNIRGMDYDSSTGTIFWSEWKEGIISSFTPGIDLNQVMIRDLSRPFLVKWDWIANNLYYTNSKVQIRVCHRNDTFCTTVVEAKVPHINSFEIAPGSGLIFWGTWSAVLKTGSGIIERANMDGSGRIALVYEKVYWPASMAADHVMKHLYWADVKLNVIERSDFNGLDRRTVVQKGLQYPYSIALFEDMVYWADWGSDRILHCNRITGEDCAELHKGDVKAEGMMIVHKVTQQKAVNPCFNKCPQMCLLKPSGFSCVCDEKFQKINSKCTKIPPEKCIEGFCLNGADCVVVGGKRFCRCLHPYEGDRCDQVHDGYTAAATDHSWIVAVLFALLMVAALTLLIFLCRRNKEKISKLGENVAVSFRNPRFTLRKSGRLVVDTDDPGCDELMLGQKGEYKASGFGNPLFGQEEPPYSGTAEQSGAGEFKRWSSYDSEDSAFVSDGQAKEDTMLHADEEALVDAPKKGKILQFFRKT